MATLPLLLRRARRALRNFSMSGSTSSSDEAPAAATTAADDDWRYTGTPAPLLLAPMVRVNTLPFRLLAAEHGAHMVYSEELVDRSVSSCTRRVNAALNTIEFVRPGSDSSRPQLIFSTKPHERVAFQLGTADAAEALRAARVVADDVRAIDVNMGCPVKFSLQGGMGSALLTQPEKVRDILTTLVRNLGGKPVTCKIRLLESPAETLQLCRAIAECGVAALAVHARRRHDRPRHWAQWDQVALLRDALPKSLPLVLNGDVFSPDDVPRALAATGADALMLARGAMWNPSLFDRGRAALAPPHEVVGRYVELAEAHANSYGNTKYVCMQMLEGYGKTAPHRLLQKAKDYPAMRGAVEAMRADPAFAGSTRVPTVLEPAPDLPPERTVALPVNAWRHVAPHVSGLLKRSREAAEAAAEGT